MNSGQHCPSLGTGWHLFRSAFGGGPGQRLRTQVKSGGKLQVQSTQGSPSSSFSPFLKLRAPKVHVLESSVKR